MRLLLFFYLVLTVFICGFMVFRDELVWSGIALLIGSLLGFVGGSGMRGAFYMGQRTSGAIVGVVLLFAGMALPYYSEVTLDLFGVGASGDVWPAFGFALGFLATRPSDAAPAGRIEPVDPEAEK